MFGRYLTAKDLLTLSESQPDSSVIQSAMPTEQFRVLNDMIMAKKSFEL
jgi:hypothetical protein